VDDATLVRRARGGDAEAFGALVSRHERAMLAIARAYFASEADAEDAAQEAFVKGFQALGQLKSPERFKAWMARITATTCIDILRSRSEKVSLADFASTVQLFPRLGQEALTPGTLASAGERADLLRAAIGLLPEEQRVVLTLRYVEDMSYDQIAAYLDLPASTVRGRLHYAKQALREALRTLETAGD
jgi:RNA polymerase sigma-70 factor (ECF subfamily)